MDKKDHNVLQAADESPDVFDVRTDYSDQVASPDGLQPHYSSTSDNHRNPKAKVKPKSNAKVPIRAKYSKRSKQRKNPFITEKSHPDKIARECERLRFFLKSAEMKQADLNNVGISVVSANQYIRGHVRIPIYVLALLEMAYSVNKKWLQAGEGEMLLEGAKRIEFKSSIAKALIPPRKATQAKLSQQGGRLRDLLIQVGIRPSKLLHIGIRSSMISQYLHARVRIPSYVMGLLVLEFNLNPHWLRSDIGPMFLSDEEIYSSSKKEGTLYRQTKLRKENLKLEREKSELRPVKHLGAVAAGMPIPMPDDWSGSYSWVTDRAIDFKDAEDYYTLTVRGDSMIEAGIRDGDQVIIRHQNTVSHGKIAVVSMNGEATLKQIFFQKSAGVIELRPCNKELTSIILDVSDYDTVEIHGILVGLLRKYN